MVEVTSKPTDISKIQDIMNAISSNGGSDKTGLMVDYAAGSKLESGINELKMIGKEQAVYLKKMVGYQEAMLGKARREDVSSAATPSKKGKKDNDEEESKSASLGSVLAAAGSAGLMSLLGPLGLQAAAGMLLRGGGGADKLKGAPGNDRLNVNDTKPKTSTKYLTVDERLAAIAEDKRLATLAEQASSKPKTSTKYLTVDERLAAFAKDKLLASIDDLNTVPKPKLSTKYLTVDEHLAALGDKKPTLKPMPPMNAGLEPFKLTQDMRVTTEAAPKIYPKISDAPTKGIVKPPKMSKVPGALGALLSGGMGYFDQELKDAGLDATQRIRQGLLESIPGAIDMFVQGLITDPLNSITGRGFAAEEDKFNLDITPAFRKYMLASIDETPNKTIAAAPNRMTAFKTAMAPTTVPDKTLAQPQAAPIIIAPPAAPASSVVNSNNQQTTIVNQTKNVSASLYTQMLGGNR
jgi:hypothetical protein